MTRRSLLMLAGGLAALGAAYVLHRRSDEHQLRAASEDVARALGFDATRESSAARRARIEREFSRSIEPGVVVRVPDLPELGRGREKLLEKVIDTGGFDGIDVALSDASISVDESGSTATLRARAKLSAAGATRRFDDMRSLRVSWVRRDGGWRITSIEVGAATHEHPEARP